jgi:NTP pyrophosphatase (non-canonical NTP hydrolase)
LERTKRRNNTRTVKLAGSDQQETERMKYEEFVTALVKDGDKIKSELTGKECHAIHMIMGICGEAGELLDAVKKAVIYRKPLDEFNVTEELGDIEFYLEGFRQSVGISRDEVIKENMYKLSKRYSKIQYTDEDAQTRADKA